MLLWFKWHEAYHINEVHKDTLSTANKSFLSKESATKEKRTICLKMLQWILKIATTQKLIDLIYKVKCSCIYRAQYVDKVRLENNSGNVRAGCEIIIQCIFFIAWDRTKGPVMGSKQR